MSHLNSRNDELLQIIAQLTKNILQQFGERENPNKILQIFSQP